jgi:ankyrin repeat protein
MRRNEANLILFDTVTRGCVEEARIAIIRYMADPNARDIDGTTPLHYAAKNGFGEVVRLLLEQGADARVINHYGETPLRLAARYGHREIEHLLQDAMRTQV